jgi:hypothetical protein
MGATHPTQRLDRDGDNVLAGNVMALVGVSTGDHNHPLSLGLFSSRLLRWLLVTAHLLLDVAAPRPSSLTEGPQWLQERPTRYYAGGGIKSMDTMVIPIEEFGELASRIDCSQSSIGVYALLS